MYYQGKKTLLDRKYLTDNDKTIVIVDDGAATGSTIIAALRSLRKQYNPKCIIAALTVSPRGAVDLLRREGIDHIEVVTIPNDKNFGTIEQFYQNFDQVSDSEILNIINAERK